MIEQNFGVEIPKEKWMMLSQMIIEDGWSELRFKETLKWFLLNKKWQSWTIADWFDYGVKLHPVEWMKREIGKMGNPERAWEKFDRYKINDVIVCKWKDGVELPLEKIQ